MHLYLIPTPLAPDADQWVSPQLREVLARVDYFLVENERTARRFLGSLGLGRDIRSLRFGLLTKDTTAAELEALLAQVVAGSVIGVLSEAGCPGVADPGALAVAHAHRQGWKVTALPGPSSVLLALMASGLNGQCFAFHGYLPIQPDARQQAIRQLEQESARRRQAQLFIETPYRNQALFDDLLRQLSPHTRLCVACHLTAVDEWVRTCTVSQWRSRPKPELHRLPTVFVFMA